MMATAGDVQEELEDSRELADDRVNMADIESGGRDAMHHRKSRGKTIAF
tara:strand:- start:362 stop:508 length:147 start_codon:yes stop_codon:yes gene_type:complete